MLPVKPYLRLRVVASSAFIYLIVKQKIEATNTGIFVSVSDFVLSSFQTQWYDKVLDVLHQKEYFWKSRQI